MTQSDLDALFRPMSIAIVGASPREASLGYKVLDNILTYGFQGTIFPVNPNQEMVHSMKCYPSVEDIPDPVTMAVIVVPRESVLEALEQCGRKKVRSVVVITAGFKEMGAEGEKLQKEILETVKRYGMRLVGPNCMGVINTDPHVRLDATFAPCIPPGGSTAFVSESGALGVVILHRAIQDRLGISKFISIGNRADVSPNDVLEYLEGDPKTNLILMYLEHFGNPRKFTQLARRIIKKKPIIVVKSGRTRAGAKAALSHTGAMATTDIAAESLFEQCGVLRVDSVEEMFNAAMAFSTLPIPRRNRTAIVTNAGGPGIIMADVCEGLGLEVVDLQNETKELLIKRLKTVPVVQNPLDLISDSGPLDYRMALETVLNDPGIDAVIAMFVTPIMTTPHEIARNISEVGKVSDKPVLGCFMGDTSVFQEIEVMEDRVVPFYQFPESAGKALYEMVRYHRLRDRLEGRYESHSVDQAMVTDILQGAIQKNRRALEPDEVFHVLESYGIDTAPWSVARSEEEAVLSAEKVTMPVAMKVYGSDLTHKSDSRGVVLNLDSHEAVRRTYLDLVERFGREEVIVQKMITGGKETIVGMSFDANFGPLIMFGLGGIYVEILRDVSFRINPITTIDAREMVQNVRGSQLLKGVRGDPLLDMDALSEVLLRVSQLVLEFPEIRELDINPLIALEEGKGCLVVDARMSLITPKESS